MNEYFIDEECVVEEDFWMKLKEAIKVVYAGGHPDEFTSCDDLFEEYRLELEDNGAIEVNCLTFEIRRVDIDMAYDELDSLDLDDTARDYYHEALDELVYSDKLAVKNGHGYKSIDSVMRDARATAEMKMGR